MGDFRVELCVISFDLKWLSFNYDLSLFGSIFSRKFRIKIINPTKNCKKKLQ